MLTNIPPTHMALSYLHIRSYFYTFLFPSAALMPMEYCLPLMDVADIVQDLDFVVTYRQFILDRTGVALIIET